MFDDPLPEPEPGHEWHSLQAAEVGRLLPRPPSAIPPAERPRFSPTLNPSGCDTDLITRIDFWVNAINSVLSASVRSSSSDTRR